jgi:thiopeptide-type bacteriocin biosynthesis protein
VPARDDSAFDPRLVLAALLRDEDEAGAAAEDSGLAAEQLAAWRDRLIEAGLAVLDPAAEESRWVQADLAFDGSASQYQRLVASPLPDRLSAWCREGTATNAWHLHKPPGVRLRLEGDARRLENLLAPLLDDLVVTGAVTGWRFGVYLPETHLFGGPVGMRLAHQFFTADSLAVLAYHHARQQASASLSPAEFSFLLLDGLLARLVADPWERWDVWCRLKWTGRVLDDAGGPAPPGPGAAAWVRAVRSFPGPWPGASRREQAILAEYHQRVLALAETTAAALHQGESAANLRRSLPFWIVFHWNRMLFSIEAQRSLTRAVVAGLDPRGPATGG